jgi:transcriptional regulator with XRE-family HTH domain
MQKRKALRVRRAELEVNQFAVADAAGMGRDRYARIELGYADPTPDEEKAIARALKCKRADLFPEVAEATR